MQKKKILVVVAHPDDETIWCGGTLLRIKFDKTIICLCRKNDKDRAPRFEKACKILKAKCFISDLEDAESGSFKDIPTQEIVKRILQFIDNKNRNFDYIFTHGSNGEYGHPRHIGVYNAVNEMLAKKLLSAKKVFFFSYVTKGDFCHANENADKFIKLNELIFKKKKHLIQDVYGFKENSFENKCCNDVEAFNIKNERAL